MSHLCDDCQELSLPVGPAGDVGPTGPAGADGNDGANGLDGDDGTTIIYNNRTDASTVAAAGPEDLMSYSMPADTLAAAGDEIVIEALFTAAYTAVDKTVWVYFDTTAQPNGFPFNSSLFLGLGGLKVIWRITRRTATTFESEIFLEGKNTVGVANGSSMSYASITTPIACPNLTNNAITIKATASSATTAGDITCNYLRVTKYSI